MDGRSGRHLFTLPAYHYTKPVDLTQPSTRPPPPATPLLPETAVDAEQVRTEAQALLRQWAHRLPLSETMMVVATQPVYNDPDTGDDDDCTDSRVAALFARLHQVVGQVAADNAKPTPVAPAPAQETASSALISAPLLPPPSPSTLLPKETVAERLARAAAVRKEQHDRRAVERVALQAHVAARQAQALQAQQVKALQVQRDKETAQRALQEQRLNRQAAQLLRDMDKRSAAAAAVEAAASASAAAVKENSSLLVESDELPPVTEQDAVYLEEEAVSPKAVQTELPLLQFEEAPTTAEPGLVHMEQPDDLPVSENASEPEQIDTEATSESSSDNDDNDNVIDSSSFADSEKPDAPAHVFSPPVEPPAEPLALEEVPKEEDETQDTRADRQWRLTILRRIFGAWQDMAFSQRHERMLSAEHKAKQAKMQQLLDRLAAKAETKDEKPVSSKSTRESVMRALQAGHLTIAQAMAELDKVIDKPQPATWVPRRLPVVVAAPTAKTVPKHVVPTPPSDIPASKVAVSTRTPADAMTERAAQREQARQQRLHEQHVAEEMRIAEELRQKKAELAAVQDARAAQRAAMQAEKLREDEKRRQFSFEIAKEQQARLFHQKLLLRNVGWQPWRAFVERRRASDATATNHLARKTLAASWAAWRQFCDEARQAKERMASETHDRNLKLGVFRALQQAVQMKSTHEYLAIDHASRKVLQTAFARWRVFVATEAEQERRNTQSAVDHDTQSLLKKVLAAWKELGAINREERESERRRALLRRKVDSWLAEKSPEPLLAHLSVEDLPEPMIEPMAEPMAEPSSTMVVDNVDIEALPRVDLRAKVSSWLREMQPTA